MFSESCHGPKCLLWFIHYICSWLQEEGKGKEKNIGSSNQISYFKSKSVNRLPDTLNRILTKHCLGNKFAFLHRKKTKDSWIQSLFNSSVLSSKSPGSFNCSHILFLSVSSLFFHPDYKMAVLTSQQPKQWGGKGGELFLFSVRAIFCKRHSNFFLTFSLHQIKGWEISYVGTLSLYHGGMAEPAKKERGKSQSMVRSQWCLPHMLRKEELIEILNIY